ncbi:MAG: hypothetical protein ACREEW_12805 [Caulobacteraceae bacterium]
MQAAAIQAKVWSGYGLAAARVGVGFGHYRPSGPANPISPANLLGQIEAAFTVAPSGFDFLRAPRHKDATFTGLFDASAAEVGDYLVGPTGTTYFVAGLAPLRPPLCVLCNRTLTVLTPGPSTTFGAQAGYMGTTAANETSAMTAWPANLLFEARGRATEVGLPLDLPSAFYSVLMPALSGVDVRTGMILADDDARRYVVSASERSGFGWRLLAQQAVS